MAETAERIERSCALLPERAVLAVAGADRRSFLQGLISNDVNKAAADRAIYAALLTAQGKYLHDFFIAELGEALYLDAEAARLADLKRRLSLYKLRAKVTVDQPPAAWSVAAAFGGGALEALGLPASLGAAVAFGGGIAFVDPRLPALGARLLLPGPGGLSALSERGFRVADADAYDLWRLRHGVPDGSRDLVIEKSILLESGFEELNGVDWQKGCYMGQELTARTKYRGLVKKRLMPVSIEGPLPPPGTPITRGEQEAGEMRSARDGVGLALLRLDMVESGAPLIAGNARLTARKPDWARF